MPEDTTSPVAPSHTRTGVSAWWRALGIFLALVVLLGWALGASMYEQFKAQIHHLEAKLVEIPQVRDVSVLLDDAQAPRMLGVLTNKYKTQQLDVPVQALEGARILAISVENKDRGPRDGKPRQPLLLKGWLVQKAI